MPVYRVPAAFSRALVLLLLPGVPTLAERRMAGIGPEDHVRQMVRMCFGDPARVPRARLEQAVREMRERADQPWADRALTRSMRGLITSYLRVGGQRLAGGAGPRPPTLVLWAAATSWSIRLSRPGSPPPARTPGCSSSRGSGLATMEAPQPTAGRRSGMVEALDEHRTPGPGPSLSGVVGAPAAVPGGPEGGNVAEAPRCGRHATERETLGS